MAMPPILGEFEQIVLLGVLQCGGGAYGVPIWKELEARTGRSVSLGAVYKTLDRLEGKGYVTGDLAEIFADEAARAPLTARARYCLRALGALRHLAVGHPLAEPDIFQEID